MEIRLVSCLEKVFPDGRGTEKPLPPLTVLKGETVAFQAAIRSDKGRDWLTADLSMPFAAEKHISMVESVPVRMMRTEMQDDDYLSHETGMYPDALLPLEDKPFVLPGNIWRSLYVELCLPEDAPAGIFSLCFTVAEEGAEYAAETTLEVVDAVLPAQDFVHTEWFHADCLADYYHVPVWSERHWEIVESFMRTAAEHSINMLLTPHVTQPLDTRIGGERTTVQLVDITADAGEHYTFDFSRLERWIDMAQRCGIRYFEMAHLFTQWGAKAAPKVVAMKDGQLQRIFGWDTPAVGGAYERFLKQYLPALTGFLHQKGVADRCFFHISDEPHTEQLEDYFAAKAIAAPYLKGFRLMDALSEYELAMTCKVDPPVAIMHKLHHFIDHDVQPLWCYYCCIPTQEMTNRFLQMKLTRTRAIGLMWYKYNLKGFLHWGYNFYNTVHSVGHVNPWLDTESGGFFTAGDPFVVYPGGDGKAVPSLRLKAMQQAMQDLRALCCLEHLTGRVETMRVLEKDEVLTLTQFPRESDNMHAVRNRINAAIRAALAGQKAE